MVDNSGVHSPVAVLGNGPWGTMLADLLAVHHEEVLLWGEDDAARASLAAERHHPRLPGVRLSSRIRCVEALEEVAEPRALVMALHPDRLRDVMAQLGGELQGDHRVLCAGRGLEPGTSARMTEIVRQESAVKLVAALAGPQLTLETAQGAPGGGVVASPFKGVALEFQDRLASPRYRVYTSRDVVGVEYGPVLASVVTFVVGVGEGAGLGPGGQALLLSRGLVEITRLGVALGAEAETFSGMSTLGVLLGSCLARTRDEYLLGVEVGRDPAQLDAAQRRFSDQGVLGNAHAALGLARGVGVDVPLLGAAVALLTAAMTPDQLKVQLMTRPVTGER